MGWKRLSAYTRREVCKGGIQGQHLSTSDLMILILMCLSLVAELEDFKNRLAAENTKLTEELDNYRVQLQTATAVLEDARRSHKNETEDTTRRHRNELEDIQEKHRREVDRLKREAQDNSDILKRDAQDEANRLLKAHSQEVEELERRLKNELEDERSRHAREVQEQQATTAAQLQNAGVDLDQKQREAQRIQTELEQANNAFETQRDINNKLQEKIAEASANALALDSANKAMQAKITFLESDNQQQGQAFADLHKRMQEAIEAAEEANVKLRAEETLRRKLHNQVQELKGNIRVFCRVRPILGSNEEEAARITYPDDGTDSKEIEVKGPEKTSALGNATSTSNPFAFDRVFGPSSQNAEVFEEISQLVQSALDGYNVCIFCYGQTGSGKTHTMSSADGMIPRAVAQIWAEAERLKEKHWTYTMEGSFVEVYNEQLNDLLGKSEELDKKKLDIKHDAEKKTTAITNANTVVLQGPDSVEEIMVRAQKNRTVAATKANERSSRSHSVFILKLSGTNSITGETSSGTLNLVDLAGSERLSHSQAEGQRLKETQNINKSLSCLGDVIGALGNGKENAHVPYRNSKLTYLLQYSLGGNSKTLMFVMVSPLKEHLSETLTSLKFATKVSAPVVDPNALMLIIRRYTTRTLGQQRGSRRSKTEGHHLESFGLRPLPVAACCTPSRRFARSLWMEVISVWRCNSI